MPVDCEVVSRPLGTGEGGAAMWGVGRRVASQTFAFSDTLRRQCAATNRLTVATGWRLGRSDGPCVGRHVQVRALFCGLVHQEGRALRPLLPRRPAWPPPHDVALAGQLSRRRRSSPQGRQGSNQTVVWLCGRPTGGSPAARGAPPPSPDVSPNSRGGSAGVRRCSWGGTRGTSASGTVPRSGVPGSGWAAARVRHSAGDTT